MALYPNGRIPQSALSPVPALNGQTAWLLPYVAAAYLRVAAELVRLHRWEPVVTSAGDGFRSWQRQVNVYLERYEPRTTGVGPFGDVRYWQGVRYVRVRGAAAAVPGTSNHGLGIAIDVSGLGAFTSLRYRQFKAVAEREGFSNAEGARIDEPWHWVYLRTAYPVTDTNAGVPGLTIPTVGGNLPGSLTREGITMDDATVNRLFTEVLEQGRATLNYLRVGATDQDLAPGLLDAVKAQLDTVEGKVTTVIGQGDETLRYLRVGEGDGELAPGVLDHLVRANYALEGRIIALQAALDAGSAGVSDPAAVRAAVEDALAEFKATLTLTVD